MSQLVPKPTLKIIEDPNLLQNTKTNEIPIKRAVLKLINSPIQIPQEKLEQGKLLEKEEIKVNEEIQRSLKMEERRKNVDKKHEENVLKNETFVENYFMMFDGTKKAQKELKIGDELMGEDSKPCKILNIIEEKEMCYLITPVKGDKFMVGESDVLSLSYSGNSNIYLEKNSSYILSYFNFVEKREIRKSFNIDNYGSEEKALEAVAKYRKEILERKDIFNDNNYFNISVKEFLERDVCFQENSKIFRAELDFPHVEFKIDPYIIGIWLGDGTSGFSHITSADQEIVDYFKEYFEEFDLNIKSRGISHYISGKMGNRKKENVFIKYMKEIGIFENKHIPLQLLLTSRKNRLSLLAGLLDSDGYLHNNCYDFIQKREQLFDEFIFLCRSLGFSCYKSPCVKICTNSANGPAPGNYFRCMVSGEGLEEIPTLLNRKKAHERQQIKRTYVSGIENIEEMGEIVNYKIITDNPRFLLYDFTVRHRNEIMETVEIKKERKISTLPYGYKKRSNIDGDYIIVDEKEVEVIKFIFKEYNNVSLTKLAEMINLKRIRTRNNSEFSCSSVRSVIDNKNKYLGGLRDDMKTHWPVILEKEEIVNAKHKKMSYPFGYKKLNNKAVIVELQSEMVKFIFEKYYDDKLSHEKISNLLNDKNLKPSKGEKWSRSSVSTVLRKKEIYLGISDRGYPPILDKSYETKVR